MISLPLQTGYVILARIANMHNDIDSRVKMHVRPSELKRDAAIFEVTLQENMTYATCITEEQNMHDIL